MRTLIDIAGDISTQDNRCTASPMLILLQVKKRYVAHSDYCTNCKEQYIEQLSGDYLSFDTYDELLNWWNRDEEEEDKVSELEENSDYVHVHMGHYWETENVFFTDKGYEEHMKVNSHNYRKGEVRSYGIHTFRNDEMKQVLETIMAAQP